jgi:hypothetical protein
MTRYFVRLAIGTLVLIFLTSASIFGMEAYIPHITGGYNNWIDYLLVDNSNAGNLTFDLFLLDEGAVVYSGTFNVPGLSGGFVDLKSYAPTAEDGLVSYDDAELKFRLSYEELGGGGVAEFQLTGELNTILSFNFSGINPNISWKGIALANFFDATASVELYAVGSGGILGQDTINIAPRTRVLGTHDVFFPYVSFNDVQRIIAVSRTGLCGITISGSTDNSLLLFTTAASEPKFDSADPYFYNLIMTEKMQGTWYFEYTTTSTFDDWYDLNYPTEEVLTMPGQYIVFGYDNYDELVSAMYQQDFGFFSLLDPESDFDKFYTFNFESENEVSGCYFEVVNNDTGSCYPMDGTKIRPHNTGSLSPASAVKSMKGSDTPELHQSDESALRQLKESQELSIDSEVDQDVVELYHRLKDIHNQRSNESTP